MDSLIRINYTREDIEQILLEYFQGCEGNSIVSKSFGWYGVLSDIETVGVRVEYILNDGVKL